ncbi:MAG TPA: GntR family transcriptional regulator [Steroidobacteraceae bacterium]|nr:GntR family transcriptional regulator [Steroidobacteraceae bacterium]
MTRNGNVRAGQTVKAMLRLRQMILDGKLKAGERVPELTLVEHMGVSRTPIRAALMQLAEEGLLEPSTSGGFVVRAFDESEVFDAIDLRGTLEGAAARRAAERHPSSEELSSLQDCVAAMDAIAARRKLDIEHFTEYVRLNEQFHALLVDLANSAVLRRAIDRVLALPFASPSAFVLAQSELPQSHQIVLIAQDQHRAILSAIAAGESARAESIAREHSSLAKRNLQSAASREMQMKRIVGGNLIKLRSAEATGAKLHKSLKKSVRA